MHPLEQDYLFESVINFLISKHLPIMKNIFLFLVFALTMLSNVDAQVHFSDETKKFIDYADSIIVFRNASLIDGKGTPAQPHQTVVVSNGKIEWVGDDISAKLPEKSSIVDLNGKVIMPGLVMLHEHMYISASSLDPTYEQLRQLPVSFPRLYLASGATTIRTAGSIEPYSDMRIKKDIDHGLIPGPNIELTAPYIEGINGQFAQMNELKNPDEATRFVNYWADQGMTSFKAYMNVTKPILKAAIDAAHKRHLKITGHLNATTYREAAELGIDQLEHGFFASTDFVKNKKENENASQSEFLGSLLHVNPDGDSVKQLTRFLIDKRVALTSTLAVFEGFKNTQPMPSQELLDMMSPDTRDFYLKLFAVIKSAQISSMFDKVFANCSKMEKIFYDMGGLLTAGCDPTGNGGTLAGYGDWRAIELLVEADGFTPLQAIKIATLNGAIAIGLDKNVGSIEAGKSADLLIIDGDPSKNISDIRKVLYVFKNGIGYNSKRLFDSMKGKVGFD
jgi:imidazolonepropionase-like amidohydrolase